MATDHIRYDVLARDALRGVLRRVLTDAAEHGLPGEHHFFITFVSTADGVKLSPRLLAQYPEEMTVILQHQFWDLVVTEDRFEVGLSFNGIPERLVVPFSSIKSFFDPSVQFGLQFEPTETVAEAATASLAAEPAPPAVAASAGAAMKAAPPVTAAPPNTSSVLPGFSTTTSTASPTTSIAPSNTLPAASPMPLTTSAAPLATLPTASTAPSNTSLTKSKKPTTLLLP
eukprot:gene16570-21956_t